MLKNHMNHVSYAKLMPHTYNGWFLTRFKYCLIKDIINREDIMKVVILCGGKGTRLSEKTEEIPKPLVEIDDKPILWNIMKIYSYHGFNEFVLLVGYKGDQIKKYFEENNHNEKDWKIDFVDSGLDSNKAERLLKAKDLIMEDKDDDFFLAYGDDVSDVNIKEVLEFHKKNEKTVTLTAVNLKSPYGILDLNGNDEIERFVEKPMLEHWINGGFFVINKRIFNHLKEGWELEKEVFEKLVKEKDIIAFKHKGFWKSMNTLKDNVELNNLWKKGDAPWKLW